MLIRECGPQTRSTEINVSSDHLGQVSKACAKPAHSSPFPHPPSNHHPQGVLLPNRILFHPSIFSTFSSSIPTVPALALSVLPASGCLSSPHCNLALCTAKEIELTTKPFLRRKSDFSTWPGRPFQTWMLPIPLPLQPHFSRLLAIAILPLSPPGFSCAASST